MMTIADAFVYSIYGLLAIVTILVLIANPKVFILNLLGSLAITGLFFFVVVRCTS